MGNILSAQDVCRHDIVLSLAKSPLGLRTKLVAQVELRERADYCTMVRFISLCNKLELNIRSTARGFTEQFHHSSEAHFFRKVINADVRRYYPSLEYYARKAYTATPMNELGFTIDYYADLGRLAVSVFKLSGDQDFLPY